MDDDELRAALQRALAADVPDVAAGPAPARIQALRDLAAGAPAASAAALGHRRPAARRARVLAVAAAVGLAFVAGALLREPPDPVRDLAQGIGLPVDSSDLVEARAELDRLGAALARIEPDAPLDDATLADIAAADAAMLERVARLDADEKAGFVPVAHQVHLRAVAVFAEAGDRLPTASDADLEELRPAD